VLSEALADLKKSNVKYFIHVPCPGTPNEDNTWSSVIGIKKLINNSRGKYKRNECLINVCKSDTDLS
jgi:hypothetical protein